MKRFLALYGLIMFCIFAVANYYDYQLESYAKLVNPAEVYTYEFEIPNDFLNSDPKHLEGLKEVALKNQVNIIRTVSHYDNRTENTLTDAYLYLTTDTRLYEHVKITEGRILQPNDMDSQDFFISTKPKNSEKQKGVIRNFGGNNTYSIHVIDRLIHNYTYSGNYRIEAESQEHYNQFIADYVSYINHTTGEDFSKEMYTTITRSNQIEFNQALDIELISIFLISIFLLTFLFYLVTRTKELAVMKLNGYSNMAVSWKIFILFFTKIFTISSIILIPWMFFIEDIHVEFIQQVYVTNFIIFVVLFVILTGLSFLYSKNISIESAIKGNKPIGIIALINMIGKIAISIVMLVIAVSLISNLEEMNRKQNSLENWSDFYMYGVFHPVKSGEDIHAIRNGEYPLDLPTYELYSYLNQEFKALYIDSDIYTEESLEANAGNSHIRYITVNPNYLAAYPIVDTEENPIHISENVEHTVLLVPEQYKDKEDTNVHYFTSMREDFYTLHNELYNRTDKAKSIEIEIIYTKEDQEIFSMNPNVMPDNNNMIVDPIVQVITEANALVPDTHYTSSSNQTFFIQLIEQDTESTYNKMLPVLQEYGLDDNFPYLIQTNEVILSEINDLKQEATTTSYILLLLFILIVLLLFQNIYLQFERNKYEFFLRKIYGNPFLSKYKKVFILLVTTLLLEFIGGVILIEIRYFLTLFIAKMLIETCLMILLIRYFERKNTIQVLKEGV
ncbi:bacteriocin-associated integral membrane protein [Gracilibacillus halotolerans]|uniref:Bacteriocin-associated integral membrane protein n=1 Tax=Gracilibacillus halotolerans TaxID=74386 RepID=A0A841RP19_9BACI|nr:DUF1430 domain-containing protein [Gracilibacillus halotolerans]MBB6514259.1 bacteriocin-associated integral membrane protein [Gracilibacillus halotolerans]